jgi:hypothetical protein
MPILRSPLASILSLAPLALCGAALAACGAAPDATGEPSAASSAEIIKGVDSGPDDDFTVAVYQTDASGAVQAGCTGALIAENLVLTARHCVASLSGNDLRCSISGTAIGSARFGANLAPNRLAIATGSTRSISMTTGVPSGVVAHGAQIITPPGNVICNSDIALIVLDTTLSGAMLVPLRLDAPPVKDELMTAIGWGVVSNSVDFPTTRQRRADIAIKYVGPANTPMGPIGSSELEVGESICEGDSGGPAFAQATGSVIGVVSRGGNGATPIQTQPAGTCTGTNASNTYTRVDGWKDLILSAFDAAGAKPWLEGQPDPRKADPLGAPCDDGSTCASKICIGTSAGSICSQACGADAPCPGGYTCQAVADQRLCVPPTTSKGGGCAIGAEKQPDADTRAGTLGLALATVAALGIARRVRSARRAG